MDATSTEGFLATAIAGRGLVTASTSLAASSLLAAYARSTVDEHAIIPTGRRPPPKTRASSSTSPLRWRALKLLEPVALRPIIDVEITEDDLAVGVDHDEPRRAVSTVILHHGRKSLPALVRVVTEGKYEIVTQLRLAQLLNRVDVTALEYGLYDRETDPVGKLSD